MDELRIIKRGLFNSGAYVVNVDRLRRNGLKLADYLDLAELMRGIFPKEPMAYYGDQGLLSVAFAGDIAYHAYPGIRNILLTALTRLILENINGKNDYSRCCPPCGRVHGHCFTGHAHAASGALRHP